MQGKNKMRTIQAHANKHIFSLDWICHSIKDFLRWQGSASPAVNSCGGRICPNVDLKFPYITAHIIVPPERSWVNLWQAVKEAKSVASLSCLGGLLL